MGNLFWIFWSVFWATVSICYITTSNNLIVRVCHVLFLIINVAIITERLTWLYGT